MISLQFNPQNETMSHVKIDGDPNQVAIEIGLLISEAYKEMYRQYGDTVAWRWKESLMGMLRPRGFWELSLEAVKGEESNGED